MRYRIKNYSQKVINDRIFLEKIKCCKKEYIASDIKFYENFQELIGYVCYKFLSVIDVYDLEMRQEIFKITKNIDGFGSINASNALRIVFNILNDRTIVDVFEETKFNSIANLNKHTSHYTEWDEENCLQMLLAYNLLIKNFCNLTSIFTEECLFDDDILESHRGLKKYTVISEKDETFFARRKLASDMLIEWSKNDNFHSLRINNDIQLKYLIKEEKFYEEVGLFFKRTKYSHSKIEIGFMLFGKEKYYNKMRINGESLNVFADNYGLVSVELKPRLVNHYWGKLVFSLYLNEEWEDFELDIIYDLDTHLLIWGNDGGDCIDRILSLAQEL